MWLVLASLFLSTAHADNRDCVTKDYMWRVHTEDDGATWRVVRNGEVLTDKGKLDVEWHADTQQDFNSDDASKKLFKVEATVKHPEGKPIAEGVAGDQRLDLRCAVIMGAQPPAPAAAPTPPKPAPKPVPEPPKTMTRDKATAPAADPAAKPADASKVAPAPKTPATDGAKK